MALNKDFKVKNGATITQDLSVGGNAYLNALTGTNATFDKLTATEFEATSAIFTRTIVTSTSALSVINNGTGPALYVRQKGASQPIAEFVDQEGGVIYFADTGNLGINTKDPNEKLTVSGKISGTRSIEGLSLSATSTNGGFVSAGRDLADIFATTASSGSVCGSGTTGRITKWSGSTTLTDSIAREAGSQFTIDGNLSASGSLSATKGIGYFACNVGIGNNRPGQKLTVTGNISATGNLSGYNINPKGDIFLDEDQRIYFEDDHATWIETDSADRLRFVAGGKQMLLLDQDTGDRAVFGFGTNVGINIGNNSLPNEELTVSGNISATGTLSADGGISVPDGSKITAGSALDLQIYHDGSNSYINETGTGDLYICGGNDIIFKDAVGNLLANMNQSNSVELYYGGSKKFETTSTGSKTSGSICATNDLNVDGDATVRAATVNRGLTAHRGLSARSTHRGFVSAGRDLADIFVTTSGNVDGSGTAHFLPSWSDGNTLTDSLLSGGTNMTRTTGSLSATTNMLAGGSVGIGTCAPNEKLTVVGNISATGTLSADGAIRVPDSTCITLGNSEDLQLYHDGSNSYIRDESGTGDLIVSTNAYRLKSANNGETMMTAFEDGAVNLYHNNITRFRTDASGVDIVGGLSACNTRNGIVSAGRDLADIFATSAGNVDGSGTANFLPLWSDSDTLTNSIACQTASNLLTVKGNVSACGGLSATQMNNYFGCYVGIGTNRPGKPLHVNDDDSVGGICVTGASLLGTFERDIGTSGVCVSILGSNADPQIRYNQGTKCWAAGVDQSADSFVIADGGEIHTGDYKLEVGTGQTTIHGNVSACGGLSATEAPNYFACNVGINTNWPTSYLQVSALKTIDRDLVVICGGGSGGDYDGLRVEAGNGTHLFRVNQLTYDVLTPSTGKVGIGNTAPGQKLTVSGNVSACGGLSATEGVGYFACKVGIGTNEPSELLHVQGNNATVNVRESGAATVKMRAGSVGRIGTYSNDDFSIVSNSTDQVRIKSDGKVGIGNTAPGEKLTVAGNISACGGLSATQMNSYFACNIGIGTCRPSAKLHIDGGIYATPVSYAGGSDEWLLRTGANNNAGWDYGGIKVRATAAGSPRLAFMNFGSTETLSINNSRVGIGATAPNEKLTVAGNISACNTVQACSVSANSTNGGFVSAGRDLADIFATSAGNVDGSGTKFKIPQWNDTDTLGDSPLSAVDDGISVAATKKIYLNKTEDTYIDSDSTDRLRAVAGGQQMLVLDYDTGNRAAFGDTKVAIGGGDNALPDQALTVAGNISACGGLSATKGVGYFGCKVGIGTCRPETSLDIYSSVDQQTFCIEGSNSSVTPTARIRTISTGSVLLLETATASDSRDILKAKNSSGTVFNLQADGKLGIGTEVPNETLTVAGNISACNTVQACSISANSTNGGIVSAGRDLADVFTACTGTIDGSGTTCHVPQFTDADTIGNSCAYFNSSTLVNRGLISGSNICIGGDVPTNAVIGQSRIGNYVADNAYFSHFDNGTSANYAVKQNANGATGLNSKSGQILTLNINNDPQLTVNADCVGIGTTGPAQKLHLEFANTDTSFSGGGGGAWGGEGLLIENTSSNTDTMAMIQLRTGDADIHIAGIRQGTDDNDLGLFFEASEKVRFTHDGDVGIGTTAPNKKLTVVGDISADGNMYITANDPFIYMTDDSGSTYNAAWKFQNNCQFWEWGGGKKIYFDSGSGIRLGDWGAGTGTLATTRDPRIAKCGTTFGGLCFTTGNSTRMVIQSAGNVGIGRDTPNEKLTVAGNISATGTLSAERVAVCNSSYGGFISGGRDLADIFATSSGNVDGSGTKFQIPQWNDTDTLGNSPLSATNSGASITRNDDVSTLTLHRDGSNPGTNTVLSRIKFDQDYGGTQQNWAKIDLCSNDSSTRTDMDFYVKSISGGLCRALTLHGGSSNEGTSVGIGASVTDPGPKLTVGGNLSACGGLSATEMNSYFGCKVGIGTNRPAYNLHIQKYDTTGPTIELQNSEYSAWINAWGSGATAGRTSRMEINAGSTNFAVGATTIRFQTPNVGDSNEQMRIDATGCVGIDTTTPNERLTVKGNISACGNVFANNNVYSGNKLFVFGGSTAAGNYICNNSSGDTTFFTNGGERMTIENAGNVGIGTTAPSEKLTVSGSISSQGYCSDNFCNTKIGTCALDAHTTGVCNTAIGAEALKILTTGEKNTAIGYNAGCKTNGCWNTFVGWCAARFNTTGCCNIAIGNYAMECGTTANGNIAIGSCAMCGNKTGAGNIAIGTFTKSGALADVGGENIIIGASAGTCLNTDRNVIIGDSAGRFLSAGAGNHMYNTVVGAYALRGTGAAGQGNTGGCNTVVGYYAMNANTSGYFNVAMGCGALAANTTGLCNTGIGRSAMPNNTTGKCNVAVGTGALNSNTTSCRNIAVGARSMLNNTTGDENVAIGNNSLQANVSASYSVAIGANALCSSTYQGLNTAVGYDSLKVAISASNNTALGFRTLCKTWGGNNTAIGGNALRNTTGGCYNDALGINAMYNNAGGCQNTALGNHSLYANTDGDSNVAAGHYALKANTTGNFNVGVGLYAGCNNATGDCNVFAGYAAGRYLANGSTCLGAPENSTYIGTCTRGNTDAENNAIVIGFCACSCGSNTVSIGNSNITNTYINGTTTVNGDVCGNNGYFCCVIAGGYFEQKAANDTLACYPTGTLVVIGECGDLIQSTRENDKKVFGVTQNGVCQPIVLGAEPVLVTGDIKIGDYITTSDKPGHGRKTLDPIYGSVIAQSMEAGTGDSHLVKAMIRKM